MSFIETISPKERQMNEAKKLTEVCFEDFTNNILLFLFQKQFSEIGIATLDFYKTLKDQAEIKKIPLETISDITDFDMKATAKKNLTKATYSKWLDFLGNGIRETITKSNNLLHSEGNSIPSDMFSSRCQDLLEKYRALTTPEGNGYTIDGVIKLFKENSSIPKFKRRKSEGWININIKEEEPKENSNRQQGNISTVIYRKGFKTFEPKKFSSLKHYASKKIRGNFG